MLAVTDHADLDRTRKSLYAASIYTFAMANALFLSNKMTVFGLTIAIDINDLIALGRLSVAFLLFMFFLHSFSSFLQVFNDFKKAAFETWDEAAKEEINEIESQLSDPGYGHDYYEPEPWVEHYYDEQVSRKTNLERMKRIEDIFETLKLFFTSYALVLIVSCFALFMPTAALRLVTFFSAS